MMEYLAKVLDDAYVDLYEDYKDAVSDSAEEVGYAQTQILNVRALTLVPKSAEQKAKEIWDLPPKAVKNPDLTGGNKTNPFIETLQPQEPIPWFWLSGDGPLKVDKKVTERIKKLGLK